MLVINNFKFEIEESKNLEESLVKKYKNKKRYSSLGEALHIAANYKIAIYILPTYSGYQIADSEKQITGANAIFRVTSLTVDRLKPVFQ